MNRVLVTGATGYLGQFLVKDLKRQGYWVRALARPGKDVENADEVFSANATIPSELHGLCEGIDFVISSLGITRQTDDVTYQDVDYGANRNVLLNAIAHGVRRFVFVSVVRPELFTGNEMVDAREKFVVELGDASIDSCVVRATGFFSDMGEILSMAERGRVYVFGDGQSKMNPIHGEDLANVCVDVLRCEDREIAVGGPNVLTYTKIAELAFKAIGKPQRITFVPSFFISLGLGIIKVFSRRLHTIMSFMTKASTNDIVGDPRGFRTLADHYRSIAGNGRR